MTFNYKIAFWFALLFAIGMLLIWFVTSNSFINQIDAEKEKVKLLCDLDNDQTEYTNKLTDMINNFQITYFEPENVTILDKLTPLDCENLQ